MISSQNTLPSAIEPQPRTFDWMLGALPALLFAAIELAALLTGGSRQWWVILPILVAFPISFWLFRAGRSHLGNTLLMAAIGLQTILISLTFRGVSVPHALTSFALIVAIGLGSMPRRSLGIILASAAILSFGTVIIDFFGSTDRPLAALDQVRWIFSYITLALFVIFLARQFAFLDLRTKIIAAILGTGGIFLAILITFALAQATQTTDSLTSRLDESVRGLAEEQLLNTAFIQASQANQEFEDIAEETIGLADIWLSLRGQERALNSTPYWDASENLVELEGGSYGNSSTDTSSVFLPAGIPLDEPLITDLNVSAYLDFSAPAILKERPSLLALYAIDTQGVIRYYPNIDLASILPADFDATQRPYYSITTPLFNPQRRARWAIPYEDAAGGGLVVTVAVPVYEGDQFIGIVAADMQLSAITEQIDQIEVGETGYAFMLDDAGRVITMPDAGYEMFGIRPEDMNVEDFSKQTILDFGSEELKSVTKRMTAGGKGLLTVDVNGADTYISFYPIETNGYSIALVVPVSELQGAIIAAQAETEQQLDSAGRAAVTILLLLLVVAIAISNGLGRIIATPIQRLTETASQISAGDLTAQAPITTNDEIGRLAWAFNIMTSRLRETLDGLEKRVEERTAELSAANERNERRARQFESISRIAHTISSTRDLDALLPQITSAINQEFGFYHVGIFLLDLSREYAVLSAANSEGGQVMLSRGHRLKVGETGLVGYVTGTGKPRVAVDTGADAVFFNNLDLSQTRSEITLPLRVGEEIIGALDVQSTEPDAFTQEDISILSTLADQVSVAIQNAQQFEETRKALNESEVLSRQFVHTGWQQFTKSRNLVGIRHTGARASLLHRRSVKTKSADLLSMTQTKPGARGTTLSLPIKLRGEVIGSVDVRAPDSRPWDQDELDIVTAIIERAAIAMENARLLAESQKRAAKERIIGEISAKISMQSEINELLRTAAQELGQNLPGAEIAIQFKKDSE